MHAWGRISAAVTLVLCSGCSPEYEPVARAMSADIEDNGVHLNGVHLNGVHLNGVHLNGVHPNGVLLHSALLNLSLVGSSLVAHWPTGGLVETLVGAELTGILGDGTSVVLRVDAVTPSRDLEVARYAVSYATSSGTFRPLCGLAPDGTPVQAIPLSGTWDESEGTATGGAHISDPSLFTFACEGYTLAKCVSFGYAPWRSVTECQSPGNCHSLSLAPFHEACTRLLRADYCGDGRSNTRDGTRVDIWDAQGIQTDQVPEWTFEAEWSPSGATCVMNPRWPMLPGHEDSVADFIQTHCPNRWQPTDCGGAASTFSVDQGFDVAVLARALLRSRAPTP